VGRDGKMLTPPWRLGAAGHHSRLRTAIGEDLGIPVVETLDPRELLYIADEVFFTGTAAEISPIRRLIASGGARDRGPVAERLAKGIPSPSSTGRAGPAWLADPGDCGATCGR